MNSAMAINTSLNSSMESMLNEARLINSDIGRHSVKCNFSTRLSGRFYQNASLERHTARKSRLVEMQAKKRRLERELRVEEQRVKLLEARLNQTERAREDAHKIIITITRGLGAFQALVRRNQAVTRFRDMRHKSRMMKFVALFLQSHYRGWKGRSLVDSIRYQRRQILIHESAIAIQSEMRRRIQRRQYIDLLSRQKRISNQSATAIQAMLRGNMTRQMYLQERNRQQSAALKIQRVYRGMIGRAKCHRLRQILQRQQEKPKRVPLHMRRYSTYGSNAPRNSTKKRDVTARRRSKASADDMSRLLKMNIEPDENDSVATTLTSLTHTTDISRTGVNRGKISDRTNRATSKTSCPSTHRVSASFSKQKSRAETKSKLSTRSVASEANLSKCNDGAKMKDKQNRAHARNINDTDERRKGARAGSVEESTSHGPTFAEGRHSRPPFRSSLEKQTGGTPTVSCANARQDCRNKHKNQHGRKRGSRESQNETKVAAVLQSEIKTPREETKTPLTITREASLIVEEVLGRTIMTHSIVTSTFDDAFSENEDDLE
ncbi:hypothetical protein HJC23_004379 [Cyclotella cryptica]|uniref:Uncharacterized protein n=1 Tax=Cyclotella cryptica TaxID=29204 RepID=A0ABD3PI39_9STRA|eukprot:CCRYP_014578-RA/>CCRYP_014578-RA protein AED:0.00 eAED:0.00 QI:381/-1/1/1/-1/1/1/1227/548